ncbi:response regulator transcription factor [Streptomyces sp. ICC4]|uniref:response regulator n=1 Tax=Streptomyces sp. ICC4 TaxID=2099584 RepID=UPI000DC7E9A8|nr:response regulator transcription factor [Streptomyces sp. ICC4]AWZ04038.1 DNA-binding response regulator [Streptomyces sp. ICC4]
MSGSSPLRVLVADDQFLIRAGLVGLLEAAPGFQVAGQAADGAEAVELALLTRPDVVLMDIRMPGTDGITATARILAEVPPPQPRVLILTTFDLDEYVYGALKAGASGFLLKDSGPRRLLAAITAVGSGDALFAPTVTRRLVEAFALRGTGRDGGAGDRRGTGAEALEALTGREVEVLELVGRGLANADIAWRLFISEATVKSHVNRTMSKLGLESRAQAVVAAYESGLVVPGGGPAV